MKPVASLFSEDTIHEMTLKDTKRVRVGSWTVSSSYLAREPRRGRTFIELLFNTFQLR